MASGASICCILPSSFDCEGFVCLNFRFNPSIKTFPFFLSIVLINPVLPLSLPVITLTLSPTLIFAYFCFIKLPGLMIQFL